jgi:hypothetical protein
MLDLKKLEKNLDKALAKETTESLTNWLQEKRVKKILSSFIEGEIHPFEFNNSVKISLNDSYQFDTLIEEVNKMERYKYAA